MRQSWLLLLYIFSSPAFAVDGAGLTVQDIVLIAVFLLLPAVPFLALAGIAILVVMLVRRVVRGPSNLESSSTAVLPPAVGDIQFTDDEANLMQRWNIFFNGTQYRLGDLKFGTLAEALAAASNAKNGDDEL